MVVLSVVEFWFVIEYLTENPLENMVCSFPKKLFPENELAELIFIQNKKLKFVLNKREESQLLMLLKKISSGGEDSVALQRIYLTEVLHFLMKLHQCHLPSSF